MKATHQLVGQLLVVAMILALVGGCVDEEEQSIAGNDGQEQNQQQNQQEQDDCDDGFFLHPITDECIEESDNDNGDEQECDADQQFDDDAQECVDRCTPDEFWDEDDEQCVDISDPGDCADFEEWDEDSEQCVPTGECGPGSLIGESCRPDLGVLPGATIELEGVDCDGMPYQDQTTADDQGIYEFDDVPAGTHDLTISSGSWNETDEVIVNKGIQTDLTDETAKICVGSSSVNIAILEGYWDDIPELLDGMDIDYDIITDGNYDSASVSAFLDDLDEMNEYDVIFVECGAGGRNTDVHDDNIRQFLENGNSLYGSDLAYDFVEEPLPDSMTSTSGGSSGTYTVDVASPEMLTLLNQDTTTIVFDTVFRAIESVGTTATVHFEGDVGMGADDTPVMMSYDEPIGGGRAIFTSFHNSAQATGEMHDILEFMIFQL